MCIFRMTDRPSQIKICTGCLFVKRIFTKDFSRLSCIATEKFTITPFRFKRTDRQTDIVNHRVVWLLKNKIPLI